MKPGKDHLVDKTAHKKLILVGPAAAGKTTFKRVFFENVNPLKLLDEGLDPTRGIENTAFSFFSQMIGVWDLAGQELNSWLGDRQDVFEKASSIVCMVSVTDPLKENASSLLNLLKIKQDNAPEADLFILINKCDLVPLLDARSVVQNLGDLIRVRHPDLVQACTPGTFNLTSIAEPYFLKTLAVAFKIIKSCVREHSIQVPAIDLQSAERRMRILMAHSPNVWFSSLDVSHKLSMSMVETHRHLEALRAGGYVSKRRSTFFSITDKGAFIANALKQQPDTLQNDEARNNLTFFMNRYQPSKFRK
ncbi:MAG: ADP-ribosylation factor-like protein [Candidatus Sigynarchaeota archaeon]